MVAVMFRPLFLNMVAVLFQASSPTRMGTSPAAAYLGTRRLETMFLHMFRRFGATFLIFEFHARFLVREPGL
jgi:hypothetical protein